MTVGKTELALGRNREQQMEHRRSGNPRRASKDAWFGRWLPFRATRRSRRLRWTVAVALLTASLSPAVQRWERWYGGTEHNDYIRDIKQTRDGGYIFGGSTTPPGPYVWLVKTDSLGDTMWAWKYDPAGGEGAGIAALALTRDGGYVATGSLGIRTLLMKTDSLGDTLWTRCLGDAHGAGYDVEQMSDGGYVVAGYSFESGQPGQARIVRTDSVGETLWTRTYGGQGQDEANAVRETKAGGSG